MKYLVIKCGGSVLDHLPKNFYQNIVQLQKNKEWQPIIVHGGGPTISTLLNRLEIETKFVDGLRVTTEDVLNIVEMVLSGSVNKQIVRNFQKSGGAAFGMSGVDGALLLVKPAQNSEQLGFVGEVTSVHTALIKQIANQGLIPVISPLGIDEQGQHYNINGDMAASAIAKAMQAELCMISDIPGIYTEQEGKKYLLKQVTNLEVEELIKNGIIYGGMVPKVRAAIDGLTANVPEVVIINGNEPDSLLAYTEGREIGTKIILG
ncbi:N-acetylglutamate kinase [Bacillus oleivorans]|uniref:Acetylglutamate kinase n=1 Tax=Bacillus oleivorans TaxID=1448271 RepID=A0A285CM02_9BACI|nr:acetylglutamate kinase [Bacillus oleivorans]SNX68043.1 N-acetylglutamate kinase [Bacillus oleivorans]